MLKEWTDEEYASFAERHGLTVGEVVKLRQELRERTPRARAALAELGEALREAGEGNDEPLQRLWRPAPPVPRMSDAKVTALWWDLRLMHRARTMGG